VPIPDKLLFMADDSTIENRVFLFKDIAAAWVTANPNALTSDRPAALAALADLAFVCCTLADEEESDAAAVAAKIRSGK
jgi:hypothetical protein